MRRVFVGAMPRGRCERAGQVVYELHRHVPRDGVDGRAAKLAELAALGSRLSIDAVSSSAASLDGARRRRMVAPFHHYGGRTICDGSWTPHGAGIG